MRFPKAGETWQHSKSGRLVEVVALGRNEVDQWLVVIYKCGVQWWVRPLSDFMMSIDYDTPRFKYYDKAAGVDDEGRAGVEGIINTIGDLYVRSLHGGSAFGVYAKGSSQLLMKGATEPECVTYALSLLTMPVIWGAADIEAQLAILGDGWKLFKARVVYRARRLKQCVWGTHAGEDGTLALAFWRLGRGAAVPTANTASDYEVAGDGE